MEGWMDGWKKEVEMDRLQAQRRERGNRELGEGMQKRD